MINGNYKFSSKLLESIYESKKVNETSNGNNEHITNAQLNNNKYIPTDFNNLNNTDISNEEHSVESYNRVNSASRKNSYEINNFVKSDKYGKGFIYFCINYAKYKNGNYIKQIYQKQYYYFRCYLGHNFILTKSQINKNDWCNTCNILLNKIKLFAKENNGKLLNKSIEKSIQFKCANSHIWTVNFKKCFNYWCKQCKKQNKKMLKKMFLKESLEYEKLLKIKQDNLLESIRQKMLNLGNTPEESHNKQNENNNELLQKNLQIKNKFMEIEKEVNDISTKHARSFIDNNKEFQSEIFNKIKTVYFILLFPESLFKKYMLYY